jgi:hypothetical protein
VFGQFDFCVRVSQSLVSVPAVVCCGSHSLLLRVARNVLPIAVSATGACTDPSSFSLSVQGLVVPLFVIDTICSPLLVILFLFCNRRKIHRNDPAFAARWGLLFGECCVR